MPHIQHSSVYDISALRPSSKDVWLPLSLFKREEEIDKEREKWREKERGRERSREDEDNENTTVFEDCLSMKSNELKRVVVENQRAEIYH